MKTKEEQRKQYRNSLDSAEKQLKKLTQALLLELIDNEEYKITKKQLIIDVNKCKEKLIRLEKAKDTSIEDTERVFDFIINARTRFNHGDLQTKREIFRTIRLNWRLKDGKLHGEAYPWFEPIKKFVDENMRENGSLEPRRKSISKVNTDAQKSKILVWSEMVNAVRKAILDYGEKIYLPEFVNT